MPSDFLKCHLAQNDEAPCGSDGMSFSDASTVTKKGSSCLATMPKDENEIHRIESGRLVVRAMRSMYQAVIIFTL